MSDLEQRLKLSLALNDRLRKLTDDGDHNWRARLDAEAAARALAEARRDRNIAALTMVARVVAALAALFTVYAYLGGF